MDGSDTVPAGEPWARRSFRSTFGAKALVGALCQIPGAFAAEVMASAGYDYLCIDMQHGLVGYPDMVAMIQAIDGGQVPALVRVPWNDPAAIMRALDAGATGVVVPMVNTPEQARQAVGATRYAPDGYRSWGPTRTARVHRGFGLASAASHSVCLVMIETPEAVAAIDDILDVPGVDGVLVGTTDLSIAAGTGVDRTGSDAGNLVMIERVAKACRQRGLLAGIACGDAQAARQWQSVGYSMFLIRSDVACLAKAAADVVSSAASSLTH